MLNQVLALADTALSAETAEAASTAFYDAMAPLGATYLQTRHYRRPSRTLTSSSHWAAGGFIKRIAPKEWPGSPAFNYICFDCNPLLGAIRESRTRYRFSDFAPHETPAYGNYWDALSEAKIDDALCATSYGPDQQITSLHLGFGRRAFEPDEALAIHMAGLLLTERLMQFTAPSQPPAPRHTLSPREHDCLSYVAEGKTDWEISVILGISQRTAKFHVENARRKLGANNRAQAVARFLSS
jgi:LuxR family quorum sensing-dependent transcriptional regulator